MNFISRSKQEKSSSSSLEDKESSASTIKEEKTTLVATSGVNKPTKLFNNGTGNKELITTITVPLTPAAAASASSSTSSPPPPLLSSAVAGTVGSATASVTTSSSSPFNHHHYQSTPNFNHQSFVLPSITNTSRGAANPNSAFSLALPIPSNSAAAGGSSSSSSAAGGGFSSSFSSLIKNKDAGGGGIGAIRNRLNDAKAFLDSETNIGGSGNSVNTTTGTRFTLSETPIVNRTVSLFLDNLATYRIFDKFSYVFCLVIYKVFFFKH